MLIYNFQKEFIGVDESDLKTLGFSNLSQLRAESADFADLFVRTPGYIHNFKHVHWIDFISCADPSEESQVIIDVNSQTFTAKISISTAYLTDNPASKAYLVYLNNLRTLTSEETHSISEELAQRSTPTAAPQMSVSETINEPFAETYEESKTVFQTELESSIKEDAPIEIPSNTIPEMIELDDFDLQDDHINEPDIEITPQTTVEPEMVQELPDDDFDYSYQYDPQIASDELGLPIDLIEEFIQDFISQAHEFKTSLYSSLDENDIDNVKILSHKLKGVAANLRIEDAFNTLSIINTSDDYAEIRSQLNIFYKIIAKLSGEEIQSIETSPQSTEINKIEDLTESNLEHTNVITNIQEDSDDDLYQDIEIQDTDVPDTIEMPELADDEFLSQEEDENDNEDFLDLTLLEENPKDILIPEESHEFYDIQKEIPDIQYSKTLVANEIGLDTETFNELFRDYIQESKTILNSIQEKLDSDDFSNITQEALKLKGMSENMRINSFLKQLETLMSSSDKHEMNSAIQTIDTIIKQISK